MFEKTIINEKEAELAHFLTKTLPSRLEPRVCANATNYHLLFVPFNNSRIIISLLEENCSVARFVNSNYI